MESKPNEKYFIALHLGAGYHNPMSDRKYKKLCKTACNLGTKLLSEGENSLDVATEVCSYLEDSILTNSGKGSNLTMSGTVECDAALMVSENSMFAGISCCKCLKNPIKTAKKILQEQRNISSLGLVSPMVISGDANIKEYALRHQMSIIENEELFTDQSVLKYKQYKDMLRNSNNESAQIITKQREPVISSYSEKVSSKNHEIIDSRKRGNASYDGVLGIEQYTSKKKCVRASPMGDSLFPPAKTSPLDTIGVICIDKNFDVTSAISSGGIALKQPGRVGHTSHFGCGCWSFEYTTNSKIAACTSGCGELLIKTNLAKCAADYVNNRTDVVNNRTDVVNNRTEGVTVEGILNFDKFLLDTFINSPYITTNELSLCGVLVVRIEGRNPCFVDFYLAHTTDSFSVGYSSSSMCKPVAFMSRLDKSLVGKRSVSQGFTIIL